MKQNTEHVFYKRRIQLSLTSLSAQPVWLVNVAFILSDTSFKYSHTKPNIAQATL